MSTDTFVYDLGHFDFDKEAKTLRAFSETFGGTFPPQIVIRSNRTGAVETFVQDQEAAIANEFWDGERCEYVPVRTLRNVRRLVVQHAY